MNKYTQFERKRTVSSEFFGEQEVKETLQVYNPPPLNLRELDIILVVSYTWSQLGDNAHFTFTAQELVYRFAADFVDNHQLSKDEYGIGEGKEMDWDEHVEDFMLEKIRLVGML